MTTIPVRVQVRCVSCFTPFRLDQEQYRELVKRSRLALVCPHCGHSFDYSLVAANAAPPPRPARVQTDDEPAPPPMPAVAAQTPVPAFPPPPFAPLKGAMPVAANAAPPAFAPLGGGPNNPMPAAPFPQGPAVPAGSEAKKLTLNERWKQLPPWVQWTAISVLVVVLAVVIFAMPTGGGSSQPEAPKSLEQPRPKAEKERARDEKKAAVSDKDSKEERP
jgi:hypothetical protein